MTRTDQLRASKPQLSIAHKISYWLSRLDADFATRQEVCSSSGEWFFEALGQNNVTLCPASTIWDMTPSVRFPQPVLAVGKVAEMNKKRSTIESNLSRNPESFRCWQ